MIREHTRRARRDAGGQEGAVLLIVLLLILMFTGLGLLAMRHTRQELRSAGAYKDNSQATALAEGALAMMATDLKRSADYYQAQFSLADYQAPSSDGGVDGTEYNIPLNPVLFPDVPGSYCAANPTLEGCVHQLSWSSEIADDTQDDDDGVDPWAASSEILHLYNDRAVTTVTQFQPRIGPCPPGYSCDDEQNYGWYIFTVEAESIYGGAYYAEANANYEKGRAVGKGRMTIGPIAVYGK